MLRKTFKTKLNKEQITLLFDANVQPYKYKEIFMCLESVWGKIEGDRFETSIGHDRGRCFFSARIIERDSYTLIKGRFRLSTYYYIGMAVAALSVPIKKLVLSFSFQSLLAAFEIATVIFGISYLFFLIPVALNKYNSRIVKFIEDTFECEQVSRKSKAG